MDILLRIFKEVLYLCGTGSILIILILLAKKIFNKTFSAKWHYYIWVLLIVRLIIPYSPVSNVSVYNLFYLANERVSFFINELDSKQLDNKVIETTTNEKQLDNLNTNNNAYPIIEYPNGTQSGSPIINNQIETEGNEYFRFMPVLAVLWIAVVIILFLYIICTNVLFAFTVGKRYRQLEDDRITTILNESKKIMKITKSISLLTTDEIRTPSLYQFFGAKILVTQSYLEKLSDSEIKYIFLHELSHYKRKDIGMNWILTMLQIIYFFNPLIWYAFHKIHEDCEISCDEMALQHIRKDEYISYGTTIIKLIKLISESYFIPITAGIGKNKSNYKRRIVMISKHKKRLWITNLLSIVLIISIGAVGLTGCSLITNDKKGNNIESNNTDTNENVTDPTTDNNTVNTGKDETEQGDSNKVDYNGEWIIKQVQAYGVGTYSTEEIDGLIGQSVLYNPNQASYFTDQISDFGKVSTSPVYTNKDYTAEEFVNNYRIPLDNLGMEGEFITEVTVKDADNFVSTFFIKDENTLILLGGGTYFELIRKTADGTAVNEGQTLAYIKSINSESKTLTFDIVELIFDSDTDRVEELKELGITEENFMTGFYIYNEDSNELTYSYDESLSIELLNLDGINLEISNAKELEDILSNREILANLNIKDELVTSIKEQYLP